MHKVHKTAEGHKMSYTVIKTLITFILSDEKQYF